MVAKVVVLRDMIDDYGAAAVANFVADRGPDVQLPAGEKPKGDFVANRTGDPAILRHPCHGGETHPRRPADNFQNGRHGVDLGNCEYVGRQGGIEFGDRRRRSRQGELNLSPASSREEATIDFGREPRVLAELVHVHVPGKAGARYVSQSPTPGEDFSDDAALFHIRVLKARREGGNK